MFSKRSIGIIFVCLSSIMWGFDGVVLTPRLYNLNPSYVVLMLHAIPFLVMNIVLRKEYGNLKNLTKEDLIFLFLLSLFGGALGTIFIVKALFLVQFKHLTVVSLLQKLQPVFAIILAGILLKERVGKHFLFWSGIAIIGGYFLTFQFELPTLVNNGNMLPAALYSLFAAFSFGSATVFGKKVLNRISFKTALFMRYGFTTIIMLVIVAASGKFGQFRITTPQNWLFFCIIGLTTGSFAIMLYYYGLRRINASVSTICELLFPISTIIFDYLFNGHLLSIVQWVSALVMVFSIYKISSRGLNGKNNL